MRPSKNTYARNFTPSQLECQPKCAKLLTSSTLLAGSTTMLLRRSSTRHTLSTRWDCEPRNTHHFQPSYAYLTTLFGKLRMTASPRQKLEINLPLHKLVFNGPTHGIIYIGVMSSPSRRLNGGDRSGFSFTTDIFARPPDTVSEQRGPWCHGGCLHPLLSA